MLSPSLPEKRLRNIFQGHKMKPKRPTIVCLCGSTRFMREFGLTNIRESAQGKIVLSVAYDFKQRPQTELVKQAKAKADELHLRKIDLADEILVLNVNGYMGETTRDEIKYAKAQRKRVRYLELKPIGEYTG